MNLNQLQGLCLDYLKDAMAGAGVKGQPRMTFMQNRGMKLNPAGTQGVVVRHPVANYETWRQAFDAHEATRDAAGMLGWSNSMARRPR